MVTIRTILVATDLSPFSFAAIEYAATLQIAFGARLHLLHVIDRQGTADEEMQQALGDAVRGALGPDAEAVYSLRVGAPADEICRYAREMGIDLVIMTTHGRTGVRHMVMGSVAERVVRRSCVPVLTIKPRELRGDALRDEDVARQLHLS